MLLEVPVANIVIGERHRQDMGDLETLAESMRELGLLQPIGINWRSEHFRYGGIAAIATHRAVRRAGFTSQDQFERARRVVTDGARADCGQGLCSYPVEYLTSPQCTPASSATASITCRHRL
jgi:hypothetical protein